MIRFGLNIGIDVERVLFLFALGFLVVGVAMALGRFFGVMLDYGDESPEEMLFDGAIKVLGAIVVSVVTMLGGAFGRKPNLADVARGLATAAAGGGLIVLGLLRPETWFASYAGGPLAIIGIFMTLKALFRL